MNKVIKMLVIVALAFLLKFYLFDLPRMAYNFKEFVITANKMDSLQNERIFQIEKAFNKLVDDLNNNIPR